MKRGFTLLELIVVVIIIGILATLGLVQYSRSVEKSRSAEARNIIGQIRTLAVAYYQENGSLNGLTPDTVNIGPGNDQIPNACRPSHYFYVSYFSVASDEKLELTVTRCGAQGKGGASSFSGSFIDGNMHFASGAEPYGVTSPVYK